MLNAFAPLRIKYCTILHDALSNDVRNLIAMATYTRQSFTIETANDCNVEQVELNAQCGKCIYISELVCFLTNILTPFIASYISRGLHVRCTNSPDECNSWQVQGLFEALASHLLHIQSGWLWSSKICWIKSKYFKIPANAPLVSVLRCKEIKIWHR